MLYSTSEPKRPHAHCRNYAPRKPRWHALASDDGALRAWILRSPRPAHTPAGPTRSQRCNDYLIGGPLGIGPLCKRVTQVCRGSPSDGLTSDSQASCAGHELLLSGFHIHHTRKRCSCGHEPRVFFNPDSACRRLGPRWPPSAKCWHYSSRRKDCARPRQSHDRTCC